MKTKFKIIGLAVFLATIALVVKASLLGFSSYSTGGTTYVTAATNYAIVSSESQTGGEPNITFLNATSDKTGAVVQFYKSTNSTDCAMGFTNTTTTNYVNSTNGFVVGDEVVIAHYGPAPDVFEYGVITALGIPVLTNIVVAPTGTTTNIILQMTLAVAPTTASLPGDRIYKQTKTGTIPVGVSTLNLIGPGIYTGYRKQPLLLLITGGTNASINAVSSQFYP